MLVNVEFLHIWSLLLEIVLQHKRVIVSVHHISLVLHYSMNDMEFEIFVCPIHIILQLFSTSQLNLRQKTCDVHNQLMNLMYSLDRIVRDRKLLDF